MKKVVSYILLSAILFSTMEIALKIASSGFDPFQMSCIRFLIGGIIILPFAVKELKKRNVILRKEDYKYFTMLGIICIIVSMSFFQFAVEYTSAYVVAVVFCTNPMFTMIFAHFLTDEKLNKSKVIALGISIIGLIFILNPFHISLNNDFIGIILSAVSAVTFGLYSALGKKRIQKYGGLAQTSFSFIFGSIILLIILIIVKKPVLHGITENNILLLLYIGVAVTGIGYLAYFMAMEKANATTASLVFFVKPAIAPILAMIILKEIITWNVIVGIICILVGSYKNIDFNQIKSCNNL